MTSSEQTFVLKSPYIVAVQYLREFFRRFLLTVVSYFKEIYFGCEACAFWASTCDKTSLVLGKTQNAVKLSYLHFKRKFSAKKKKEI